MTVALTIAFVPGVSPAKWARVWRDRFPSVELRLRPVGQGDLVAALSAEDDAVDMVFARMPVPEDLRAIPLWTETAVVATPKDSDLAKATEVTPAHLETVHMIDAGPVPADVDAALDLVEANVGVVVLPQSLFRKASRKDLVARPLADAEGTRVALVWRDEDSSELTEEFIGVVRGRTANSSRSQPDQPGGSERSADEPSRPARGAAKSGAAGGSRSAEAPGGKAKAKSPGGGKSGAGKKSNTGKGPTPGRGKMRGKPSRGSKGNR